MEAPTRAGTTGVVVGKWNPPHVGHLHLISTAAAQVDELFVLLCDRPDQTIPIDDRKRWLEDAAPDNVTVLVTPDDLPEANEPWAARALAILPRSPDVAFTSEAWGDGWAAAMGAQHVLVDLDRATVPISATKIRADLGTHFQWLAPGARADLARRIVIVGAESTGKTTLASALAGAMDTVWVPEYGRSYWEGRRHLRDQSWTSDEFAHIARGQQVLERDLARRSNAVVVADTDALVTAVWHRRYLGRDSPLLEQAAVAAVPDLYIVCAPDIPWVQDGTRESAAERDAMHAATVARVHASGAPVVIVEGDHDQRLATALGEATPLTVFPPLV